MSGYSISSSGTLTISQPLTIGTNIEFLNNSGDNGVLIFSRGALGVSIATGTYTSTIAYGTNVSGPAITATVSGTAAASAYFSYAGGSITNFLPAQYGRGGDKVTIQVIDSLFIAMDQSATASADNTLFAGQITVASGAYTGLVVAGGTVRPLSGSSFELDANEAKIVDNMLIDLFGSTANSSTFDIQFSQRTNPASNNPFIDAVITPEIPVNETPTNPCFAEGTRILTTRGDIAVENLVLGDLVITPDGGEQPIIWIGQRRLDITQFHRPETVRPIIIEQGALGPDMPSRTLRLSPDHALYLQGVLVPAKELVNWNSIRQDHRAKTISYYHIELPRHGILFAESAPAESFLDTGHRGIFDNDNSTIITHPTTMQATREAASCAPLCTSGPTLEAIRQHIASRQVGIRLVSG